MQSTLYIRIPIPFMSCISAWLSEIARRTIGRMHNKYIGVEITELSVLANSRERIFILFLSLLHLPASLYSFYLSSQPSLTSSYLHLPLLQGHVCFHTHTHTHIQFHHPSSRHDRPRSSDWSAVWQTLAASARSGWSATGVPTFWNWNYYCWHWHWCLWIGALLRRLHAGDSNLARVRIAAGHYAVAGAN